MVESKEELKRREVDSPNDADAFVAAYAPTEKPQSSMSLMF